MAEELKAGDVFVEFQARGAEQIEKTADKVSQKAKRTQQEIKQGVEGTDRTEQQRQRRMQQQEEKLTVSQRNRQREEKYIEDQRKANLGSRQEAFNEKFASSRVQAKNKQAEDDYIAAASAANAKHRERAGFEDQKKADSEKKLDQTNRLLSMQAKSLQVQQMIGNVGHAFGALPGVSAGAGIAQQAASGYQAAAAKKIALGGTEKEAMAAGMAGGAKAGVIGLAVTAIAAGIQGALKASPQAAEKMNYEADRLQAALGTAFIPLINTAAAGLERFNRFIGAPPLMNAQYSDFAGVRDRMQVAALQGNATNNGGLIGSEFGQDPLKWTKRLGSSTQGVIVGGLIDVLRGGVNVWGN